MFADRGAMPNLHQVVDFDAATNAGHSDAGAIDTGVRLYFDIALQHRRARLRDFLPALAVAGKSEAVAANNGAVLQNDVVTQRAMFTHNGMRVGEKIVANPSAAIDDNVRQQHSIVSNLDMVIDHHVCDDVNI